MTLRSRLDRLEQANGPRAWGRFITVRAGQCDERAARAHLQQHGISIGPRDLLLLETHADPGSSGHVAPNQPISHQVFECIERIEDMLAALD